METEQTERLEKRFRFQDLTIWEKAIDLSDRLFDIADDLADHHFYRFAEQLRGAVLSISNNIAEGSGADSDREFARFLGIAKKSVFETANMMIILARRNLIGASVADTFLKELEHESRMIERFRKTLKN